MKRTTSGIKNIKVRPQVLCARKKLPGKEFLSEVIRNLDFVYMNLLYAPKHYTVPKYWSAGLIDTPWTQCEIFSVVHIQTIGLLLIWPQNLLTGLFKRRQKCFAMKLISSWNLAGIDSIFTQPHILFVFWLTDSSPCFSLVEPDGLFILEPFRLRSGNNLCWLRNDICICYFVL